MVQVNKKQCKQSNFAVSLIQLLFSQYLIKARSLTLTNSAYNMLRSNNFLQCLTLARETVLLLKGPRCYIYTSQYVCLGRVACLVVLKGEWLSGENSFRHFEGLNHKQRLQQ